MVVELAADPSVQRSVRHQCAPTVVDACSLQFEVVPSAERASLVIQGPAQGHHQAVVAQQVAALVIQAGGFQPGDTTAGDFTATVAYLAANLQQQVAGAGQQTTAVIQGGAANIECSGGNQALYSLKSLVDAQGQGLGAE
ncbi:hypothetical protein D9M69_448870 [compost metagenome]